MKLLDIVILRSFAIIAVVLYHCYCPWLHAWNWIECEQRPIYSLIFESLLVGRMPLFVCVSGYLFSYLYHDRHKYQEFCAFFTNKTKRLLVPLVLYSILSCAILNKNIFDYIIWGKTHLWFIQMLFISFMTCWICAKYVKGKWRFIVLSFFLFTMFLPNIELFSIGQYFKYYVFFYIGYLMNLYSNNVSSLIKSDRGLFINIAFTIIITLGLVYLYIKSNYSNGDIIHLSKPIVIIRLFLRFYSIYLAFNLVNVYLKYNDFKNSLIEGLNDHSFGIFLFHFLFIQIVNVYFKEAFIDIVDDHPIIAPLLFFVLIFSLSYFVTNLIRKTKLGQMYL